VTPTSYLELLAIFNKINKDRKTFVENQIQRYKNGVTKIEETKIKVNQM